MMSSAIEAKGVGPLDFTRMTMSNVSAVAEGLKLGMIDAQQSAEYVLDASESLPYCEQPCLVEGTKFMPDDDIEADGETGQLSLDLDIDNKTVLAGVYRGLTLIRAGDGRGEIGPLVAHVFEELEETTSFDRHGNRYTQTDVHYFSIFSTEITPIEPENCHSLEDLTDDPYKLMIDNLIAQKSIGELRRLRGLGEVIVSFANSRSNAVQQLNHQRLSYLNGQGVFSGLSLKSTEFIPGEVTNNSQITSDVRVFDSPKNPLKFEPGNMIVLNAYRILRTGQAQIQNGGFPLKIWQKQVPYVRGVYGDFEGVAPLSAVTSVGR